MRVKTLFYGNAYLEKLFNVQCSGSPGITFQRNAKRQGPYGLKQISGLSPDLAAGLVYSFLFYFLKNPVFW